MNCIRRYILRSTNNILQMIYTVTDDKLHVMNGVTNDI